MVANQTIMTGPNSVPIEAVPRLCIMNKPTRIAIVIGTTADSSAGAATLMPSTADSTEIAGVITASP